MARNYYQVSQIVGDNQRIPAWKHLPPSGEPDPAPVLRDSSRAVALTPEQPLSYSDDGVDLTLIRCTLAMTPAERLDFLDSQIADIEAIRKLNARKLNARKLNARKLNARKLNARKLNAR